jgi:hypothetical protein
VKRARPAPRIFKTSASARVASAQVALEKIRQPATWPEWQAEILATTGPPEVRVGDHVTGEARMLGFAVGGRADIVAVDENGLEQDVIVGIPMKVRYAIEPAGSGFTVTHTLEVDLPSGLSGRMLAFFLKRRLRRMQAELIEKLASGGADQSVSSGSQPRAKAEL